MGLLHKDYTNIIKYIINTATFGQSYLLKNIILFLININIETIHLFIYQVKKKCPNQNQPKLGVLHIWI